MAENTCETGLASGTNLTAANSSTGAAGDAFSSVSPSNTAAITFDSATAIHGSLGLKVIGSTAATAYLWDLDAAAAGASMAVRFYLLWSAMPSALAAQTPMGIRTVSLGNIGGLDMDATFHTRINFSQSPNTGASSYSTNAVTTGTVYRYELTGTGYGTASTNATLNIYLGETMTVAATTTLTGGNTSTMTGGFQRARFGKLATTATATMTFDDMKVLTGTSTEIGPVQGGSRLNLIVARRLAPIQAANR